MRMAALSQTAIGRLVLCGTLALGACGDKPREAPAAKPADKSLALPDPSLRFLQIEPVGESKAAAAAKLPGRLALRPQAAASLGAPTTGRVASVLVRPGQQVAAGQPLLALQSADAAAARAALAQAGARAASAEEALRRHTDMVAKGVGLELERFEAEMKAREARAELDRARRAVALIGAGEGDTVTLRAPAAGIVTAVRVTVGAMIAPGGEPIVELSDPSRLWAVADLPEGERARVTKGQPAAVTVGAALERIEGVVDGLGSRIDPETRRLPVYIALHGAPAGLSPGMYVEVELESREQALRVPVSAVLIKDGNRRVVYVQRADHRFEAREVRIGAASGGQVTILEGLKPGERVVVKGALLLDGEAEQLL